MDKTEITEFSKEGKPTTFLVKQSYLAKAKSWLPKDIPESEREYITKKDESFKRLTESLQRKYKLESSQTESSYAKTTKTTFESSSHNYSIEKTGKGQYKVTLGNWTDAGWFWDGNETDLGGFLIRIGASEIRNKFVKNMSAKGINYTDIREDIVESISKDGSGIYEISGDNVKWHFGQGIEPDYSYEAEEFAEGHKVDAKKLEEKAYEFYNSNYDEFYDEYGKDLQKELATRLKDASTYEDAFDIINEIKEDARESVREYEARKWNESLNKAFKKLKANKKPITKPKGKRGWKLESVRHSLARKGIKTGRKKR